MTVLSKTQKTPALSIVVPCYNEAANLEPLYSRILTACGAIDFELIFIDDGSTDRTVHVISGLQQKDSRIRAVSFVHNFGAQAALRAGLRYARGCFVVTMDADLQHPPESIPAMIATAQSGSDIVIMVRDTPQAGFGKELFSRLFFKALSLCSGIRFEPRASDFRLITRRVVRVINLLPERVAFLRALLLQLGFAYTYMPYRLAQRHSGSSSYSSRALLKLAVEAIFSFSTLPMRFFFFFGLGVALLSFLYGLLNVLSKVSHGAVPGYTDIIASILFLGGLNLVILAIIVKYLQIVLDHLKKRPEYIIDENKTLRPAHNG